MINFVGHSLSIHGALFEHSLRYIALHRDVTRYVTPHSDRSVSGECPEFDKDARHTFNHLETFTLPQPFPNPFGTLREGSRGFANTTDCKRTQTNARLRPSTGLARKRLCRAVERSCLAVEKHGLVLTELQAAS